jgi:hypothetical protein
MGVKVCLQDVGGGDIIKVPAAFAARRSHGYTGFTGSLGASGLIPKLNRHLCLRSDGVRQASSTPALESGTTFIVQGLTQDDQAGMVFGYQTYNRSGILFP